MSFRRGTLPSEILGQYLHHKNIYNSQINKVDFFLNPVVDVRIVDEVNEATPDYNGEQSKCVIKK